MVKRPTISMSPLVIDVRDRFRREQHADARLACGAGHDRGEVAAGHGRDVDRTSDDVLENRAAARPLRHHASNGSVLNRLGCEAEWLPITWPRSRQLADLARG